MFKRISAKISKAVQRATGTHPSFRPQYSADGLGVYGKNVGFLDDYAFAQAWRVVREANRPYWKTVPDIRWRAHVCVWAARIALRTDGDFVEFGVNTGMLSTMVWRTIGARAFGDRSFWLYDTFDGIPDGGLDIAERGNIARLNAAHYGSDKLLAAIEAFQGFSSTKFMRGALPGSLDMGAPERISYLSVDLNSAATEIASTERVWASIVPGAVVILDDYAFQGHERQYHAWNEFAAMRGVSIMTVPTGQGLIIT